MPKISPQTQSFTILLALALFGVCFTLFLWPDLDYTTNYPSYYRQAIRRSTPATRALQNNETPPDTSSWKTYQNETLGLSFKYKDGWKILPAVKKSSFTLLQVDPGKKYYNIKIYVSPKAFFGLDGMPVENATISGLPAQNISNLFYVIQTNGLFYAFDVGMSMSLVPEFNALVHSVAFTR